MWGEKQIFETIADKEFKTLDLRFPEPEDKNWLYLKNIQGPYGLRQRLKRVNLKKDEVLGKRKQINYGRFVPIFLSRGIRK